MENQNSGGGSINAPPAAAEQAPIQQPSGANAQHSSLTADQAKTAIGRLLKDKAFAQKLASGDFEAQEKWDNLNKAAAISEDLGPSAATDGSQYGIQANEFGDPKDQRVSNLAGKVQELLMAAQFDPDMGRVMATLMTDSAKRTARMSNEEMSAFTNNERERLKRVFGEGEYDERRKEIAEFLKDKPKGMKETMIRDAQTFALLSNHIRSLKSKGGSQ